MINPMTAADTKTPENTDTATITQPSTAKQPVSYSYV